MGYHQGMDARRLVDETRLALRPTGDSIAGHRFLGLLEARAVPEDRLRALVAEQHAIISSDRRGFAHLAARFPEGTAGEFFLDLAAGEGAALGLLAGMAEWLGLNEEWLESYEPRPSAQSYPAFVAWLALNGTRAGVALALVANLAAWGANCARVAAAIRASYRAGDDAVAFFEYFAHPPGDFEDRARAVIDQGLAAGDSPLLARRAARLLQAYELSFWDALAEGL
jgi:thiaminase